MMDTELKVSSPSATSRDDQWAPNSPEGGNITGHDPVLDVPFLVPDFQGMSGQGNNQSTDRPKGST